MKPENWIAVGSAVLTAALTAIGLYFGPKLAVKRSLEQFRSQRQWELQHEAYEEIISCFMKMKASANDTLNHLMGVRVPPLSDEDHKQFRETRSRLEELSHSSVISDEASEAIKAVLKSNDKEPDDEFLYEETESHVILVNESISTIQREARAALNPSNS